MPTIRGWIFLIITGGVLALGLARDELGTVVWGGGMLLVELVIIIVAIVGRARLRRHRGEFSCEIESDRVDAGSEVAVHTDVPFRRIVPGFELRHAVDLRWEPTGVFATTHEPGATTHEPAAMTRRLRASATVPAAGRTTWSLVPAERGDYRARGTRLDLVDLFGFTRSSLHDESPLRLLVLPPPLNERPSLPVRSGGERAADESATRVRSEELREVRPYVPGDDPRRLSWKHFASHRELLLRIGEFVPPFRGEVRCVVDDTVPPGVRPLDAGDALMAALLTVAAEASRRDVSLVCRFPGEPSPVRLLDDGPDSAESVRQESERAFGLIAGFVPRPDEKGAIRAAGTSSRSAPATLTISAGGPAPGVLSVAEVLRAVPTPGPLWQRILMRGAP